MITQYSEYGSTPTAALNLIYSKISALDQYIIFRTGEQEYSALIRSPATKQTQLVTVYRTGTSYTNQWEVSTSDSTWDYYITNEYYVHSNIGYGTMQVLPCHDIMQTYCLAGLVCILFLAVLFKGVLFPCLRQKRL